MNSLKNYFTKIYLLYPSLFDGLEIYLIPSPTHESRNLVLLWGHHSYSIL